jgi:hypothetical protein
MARARRWRSWSRRSAATLADVYPVLALLLVGIAVFTLVALGIGRAGRPGPSPLRDSLDGFAIVGASGLLITAVAVLVVGVVSDRGDRAELLAMVALFAYLVFVLAALTLTRYVGRR